MAENQLVLRINMSFSNFEDKILDWLSDTEKMFTNIEFNLLESFGTRVLVMDISLKIITSWERFLIK